MTYLKVPCEKIWGGPIFWSCPTILESYRKSLLRLSYGDVHSDSQSSTSLSSSSSEEEHFARFTIRRLPRRSSSTSSIEELRTGPCADEPASQQQQRRQHPEQHSSWGTTGFRRSWCQRTCGTTSARRVDMEMDTFLKELRAHWTRPINLEKHLRQDQRKIFVNVLYSSVIH